MVYIPSPAAEQLERHGVMENSMYFENKNAFQFPNEKTCAIAQLLNLSIFWLNTQYEKTHSVS